MIDLFVVGGTLTPPQAIPTRGRGLTGPFSHRHDCPLLHELMGSKTEAPSQLLSLVGRGWEGDLVSEKRQETASC
ncbi:hypothetical protein EV132_10979 [Rhizobium sullae]|uniref:Uncharacterized protein n=1 Tax=Rhizobium sullae TaxID=50338 RepID=A0A4R3Q8Q7_RHISU|nr:hypothetical protein EV132_10979 [Rhizobium sullae]